MDELNGAAEGFDMDIVRENTNEKLQAMEEANLHEGFDNESDFL